MAGDDHFRVRAVSSIVKVGFDKEASVIVPKGMLGDCLAATAVDEGRGFALLVSWDYVAVYTPSERAGSVLTRWEQADVDPETVEFVCR